MTKTKKVFLGIGIVALILVIVLLAGNYYVEEEVRKIFDTEEMSSLEYEEISVNLFTGNASVKKISFHQGNLHLLAEDVDLQNFSYSDYILNDRSVVDQLLIINPEITITQKDSAENGGGDEKPFEEDLLIKNLQLSGGFLRITKNDTASEDLFLKIQEMALEEVVINSSTVKEAIPFEYDDLDIESDSLFYALDEEHNLTTSSLEFKEEQLVLNTFKITPKFSKAEFDRRISYEKDRAVIEVREVLLHNLSWKLRPGTFELKVPTIEINEADISLYRNKLLPDDTRTKPLYSKMLRELGVKLSIDSININNSQIVYEEKTVEERPAGKLSFKNFKATIKNISNMEVNSQDFQETTMEAEALFMGETTLTLNLNFDISDERDVFYVNGRLGQIRAEAINPFIKPAMNIETEGNIESLYYNFRGNDYEATGDMKLEYRDFKVNILKDGEEQKKSFLSGIVNLILKNDVVNEDVTQENIQVERDRTKSIWNFLWLCIRKGALKTFT